jgi:tetratricopeptide (TPR) repeat protein
MKSRFAGAIGVLVLHRFPLFSPSRHCIPLLCLLTLCSVSGSYLCLGDEIKAVQRGPGTPAQQEYQKGADFLAANHLPDAEASFQRSLKLDPKLVGPLLGLAQVSILQGNAARADQYLQQAASLAPHDANVLTIRGHYLFFRKDYQQAEKAFKTAISLDPKLERPHYELGDLYLLGLHNPKEAIAAYHDALAINPHDSRVHYTLANALAEAGRLDEAQVQIEEASRLDPKNPAMLVFLGDFYLRRTKLDQAQETYAKALAIDPRSIPAHMGQGDLFVAKNDLDRAVSQYQAILQIAPASTGALVKIGIIDEMKARWNEAEQSYRQALSVDPKSALAANNLAWLLNEHEKNPSEALIWAKKAVQLASEDFNAQDTFGWVLRANGDLTNALVAVKKANALAPANPQILYHLGVLYQDEKQPQAAVRSFVKALEASKNFDGAADAQSRLDAIRGTHSSAATQ